MSASWENLQRLSLLLQLSRSKSVSRVVIVGTTTWGTTLSIILARQGIQVTLLARTLQDHEELSNSRENLRFLPNVPFPKNLEISSSPEVKMNHCDLVILAVPSSSLRWNLQWIRDSIKGSPVILSATKGLEQQTGKRMTQVLLEELPRKLIDRIAVLSGPNLAMEIIEGKPSSTVVASNSYSVRGSVQETLMSPDFRVYTSEDVVGVELGGALKNIIALGAGLADGLNYGDNGKAAFITRGLAEITRLGVAAGANPLTFYGLAGLGDLMATCASNRSRNRYVGEQLATGRPLNEIVGSMKNVAEGVYTTAAALTMSKGFNVEMPIVEATFQVLFEGLDPRQAVVELMGRPPRAE